MIINKATQNDVLICIKMSVRTVNNPQSHSEHFSVSLDVNDFQVHLHVVGRPAAGKHLLFDTVIGRSNLPVPSMRYMTEAGRPAAAGVAPTGMQDREGKSPDLPYKCDICEKCFQKHSSLTRHKYEHTGE